METLVKTFNELTIYELHDLLQLRSDVFVVEQNCVYPDIDGKDGKALHVLGVADENIVAYARCFPAGYYFEEAAIGRVVVAEKVRNKGYGYDLMNAAIEAAIKHFNCEAIKVSAQTHLMQFYNNLGFNETGPEYLEDGIPHIAMVWNRVE